MKSDVLLKDEIAKAAGDYVAGELAACKVILFGNDVVPSDTITLEELGEIDSGTYTWYSRQTVAPGDPYEDSSGDGSINLTWPSKQWNYSGAVPPVRVYGWAVITVVAGPPEVDTLRSAGRFDTPVLMANTLDAVIAQPSINFPPVPLRSS